jgi:hypothetical protein
MRVLSWVVDGSDGSLLCLRGLDGRRLQDPSRVLRVPQSRSARGAVGLEPGLGIVQQRRQPRANVVGILPNDAAVIPLVGAVLLRRREDWQIDDRFSEQSTAKLYPPARMTFSGTRGPHFRAGDRVEVASPSRGSYQGHRGRAPQEIRQLPRRTDVREADALRIQGYKPERVWRKPP